MAENAICVGCTEDIEGVESGEIAMGVLVVRGWSFHDEGECAKKALRLAEDDCFYCGNERTRLRYGNGEYADLVACAFCRDGKKIADTTIPAVRSA